MQLNCHITIAYKCQLGPFVQKYKIISQKKKKKAITPAVLKGIC